MMPIEHVPDWEKRLARQDACWNREIIDRPVVMILLPKNNPDYPWPSRKSWPTLKDRWMDAEYQAELALAGVMNTGYYGDALPHAFPNLGPEVFSAFFGCELEYGETTSWSIPNLKDWSETEKIEFCDDNLYWKKLLELTDTYLEIGKGKFYTGISDMHPGGDAIVAFRDPQMLSIDMIDNLEAVKKLLAKIDDAYIHVYDLYFNKLKIAGQAICSWPSMVSTKKWYVPSNDFSCMISKAMFDKVFLPGIAKECKHYEASVYHLDGPNALRHLDSLLEIQELSVIQWVYGAGNGRATDWLDVYRKCQTAGKGLELCIEPDELDCIMKNLRPEGVFLTVRGVMDSESAKAIINKVAGWK